MKAFTVMRWTIGGTVAASVALAATVALAQMRIYPNGTDCSNLAADRLQGTAAAQCGRTR